MALKKLKVVKDPENEIPVEIMEQAIVDVAEGFRRLMNSKMNRRAVILLVQHAAGTSLVTQSQVSQVLDAAQNLDRLYLKSDKK